MRGRGGVRKMNLRKKKRKKETQQRMEMFSWSQAENVVPIKMKKHPGFLLSFSIGASNHYAH